MKGHVTQSARTKYTRAVVRTLEYSCAREHDVFRPVFGVLVPDTKLNQLFNTSCNAHS